MQADASLGTTSLVQRVHRTGRRLLPVLLMAASRVAAVIAAFAAQAAVGALGGASALGVLQLFQSWSSVAGEVVSRGLPTRALRDTSVDYARGNTGAIRRALLQSAGSIGRCWLAFAAPAVIALLVYGTTRGYTAADTEILLSLLAAALAAPLLALLRLTAETLKAMERPLPAVLVESVVAPSLLLIAVMLCWLAGTPLSVVVLLFAGLAGYVVAPTILALMIRKRLQIQRNLQAQVPPPPAHDRNDQNTLWATSLLSVAFLHLPFMILPAFTGIAEIGVFSVANKLIGSITMLLLLLAAVFGPAFAREAAEQGPGLPGLLRRSQLAAMAIFLPMAGLLIAVSSPLAALFNVPAAELQQLLIVLSLGHLINAATGLCGVMLNMAGAAHFELWSTGIACLALVAVSPIVGPAYGLEGLAVLFSATIALKNLLSYLFALFLLKHRESQL